MKRTDEFPTEDDIANERDPVCRAFLQHYRRARPLIRSIVRKHRVPDEENVLGTIIEHIWRAFPTKLQEEQADLAAGKEPFDWIAFQCRIARNRSVDSLRAHGRILRRFYAEHGFTVPTSTPPTSIR